MSTPASSVAPRSSRGMAMRTPCKRIMKNRNSAVKLARTLTPVATLAPWSNAMRAHRWFAANELATARRMTMPAPGDSFASMRFAIIGWLMAMALPGFACEYPDEGGMPLRRAVTRVKTLPEVDAMSRGATEVQYLVRLDAPVRAKGACYWPVEIRVGGQLWRRYLVSPDGKKIVSP